MILGVCLFDPGDATKLPFGMGQSMVQTSAFGVPYLQTNPRDLIEGENIRKAMWVWINWINTKFPPVISSMVCWKSHHLNR